MINLININAMTWITAHEAVELTGVRMQTLYAYVSRGKIRSRQDGADPAAACITVTTWSAWRDASAGNAMPPR